MAIAGKQNDNLLKFCLAIVSMESEYWRYIYLHNYISYIHTRPNCDTTARRGLTRQRGV